MRATRFTPIDLRSARADGGARADGRKLNKYGNPPTVTPAPTTAAITVRDLQIRLYQFADDSMQGRQVGRIGNMKGTNYIAAEVKRLGLQPAGDNGTYFQVLPYPPALVHESLAPHGERQSARVAGGLGGRARLARASADQRC